MNIIKNQQTFSGKKTQCKNKSQVNGQRCVLCNTQYLIKSSFFDHLVGKPHKKNCKFKKNTPESAEKTLCLRDVPVSSLLEVLDCFFPYGLIDASVADSCIFMEFDTLEGAQKAASDEHIIKGQKLNITFMAKSFKSNVKLRLSEPKKQGKFNVKKSNEIYLDRSLFERMNKVFDEEKVDAIILQLVKEIELKPKDYDDRGKLRFQMEKFLRSLFPVAKTFIFGSSSNSLGFAGCDVDMFADLGVYPWSSGTKQQMEQRAAELTKYIANQIRRKRIGYNVIAIPRARVPIVKFKEYVTGIDIDLSFRSPMPICNSALIRLYTNAHSIVRPYLMLLRYWGKVQDVVGGAQPTKLLTNYCYTMIMLFWIMYRTPPIVPSVTELKEDLYFANPSQYKPVVVDGWDCSFSEDLHKWNNKHHETSLIGLALEFFQFYGKLDVDQFVVCPLVGKLLEKKVLAMQDPRYLPTILHPYCEVTQFPIDAAFCVQDPFEHNHNVSRGLKDRPLMTFQYKCRKAAELCTLIKQGTISINELFEPITLRETDLKHNNSSDKTLEKGTLKVSNDDSCNDDIAVLFESDGKQTDKNVDSEPNARTSGENCSNLDHSIQVVLVLDSDNNLGQSSVMDSDNNPVANSAVKSTNNSAGSSMIDYGKTPAGSCMMDSANNAAGSSVMESQTPHSLDCITILREKVDASDDSYSDLEMIGVVSKVRKNIIEITIDDSLNCTATETLNSTDTALMNHTDTETVSSTPEKDADYDKREFDFDSSDLIVIDEDNGDAAEEHCIANRSNSEETFQRNTTQVLKISWKGQETIDKGSSKFSRTVELPDVTSPMHEPFKFDFCFNARQEFDITDDGNIVVQKGKLMTVHFRETKVKEIVKFILRSCLMCSIEDGQTQQTHSDEILLKRKCSKDNYESSKGSKLRKNESGNASKVENEFIHLLGIKCVSSYVLWENRRVLSKKLIRHQNSLLYYEKALSELLLKELSLNLAKNEMVCYINIWKNATESGSFCVTCSERTGTQKKKLFKPFVILFSKLVKDAFSDTYRYLKLKS